MAAFSIRGIRWLHIYRLAPPRRTKVSKIIETRTLKIRAIAENRDGKLLPGTFANVELPLNSIKDAIVVPSEAIIPIQNGKKVFISNHGKAKEIMVETATRTDASVLILSGLKAGDTILTSGVMILKDESLIIVKIKR